MSYRRLTVSLFVVLALPSVIYAQRVTGELWRVRAQTITEDVLKDASNLSSLPRALVWAKLAELWWREDPARATTWLTNAVEVVEQTPNRESSQERERRLATAKLLLQTSPFDQKLSKRLVALVTNVDESASKDDRDASANSLVRAAISMADRDPKGAAELGAQALRIGIPTDIEDLLFALRIRDAKLADTLFAQALGVARQTEAQTLLDDLSYATFPKELGVGWPMLIPPDNLKAELLGLHAGVLNSHVNELGQGMASCFGVNAFIVPILPEFDRLLPQQALLVRQAVQKCRSDIPTGIEKLDISTSNQPANTIDALLKAATDTDVLSVRTQYQYRAAKLAEDQRDYVRAVSILDNMSDESREFMQDSWDAYRWDWAAAGALDYLQSRRVDSMNLVLNGVPARLQPFAKMAFLDRLPATKRLEGVPTIQFLNEAAAGLRKSSISESEKYNWYFGLLKLTMRYQRSEAIGVFKESIASVNRAITDDAKFLEANAFANFLPASLLEIDEFAVKETLASLTNVEARAQLRMQLLRQIFAEFTHKEAQKTQKPG